MRVVVGVLIAWTVVLASCGQAVSSDWSQWRGTSRDGVADGSGLPAEWPESLRRAWGKRVGTGHSSPVVHSSRVYQMSREGDREVVRGLDLATGRELWKGGYRAKYKVEPVARDHGAGPKSTPVLVGGRLVTFGISGILSCWDTSSGRRVWSHEFSQRHRLTSPLYGHAASPIVVDGRVIVHVGGHDDGALCAFDLASGQLAWRWAEDGPAYASPVLLTVAGKRHLVTQSQKFHLGLDPATGTILWREPFTTQFDQNSVTPLVVGRGVIVGGYNRPTEWLEVTSRGGRLRAESRWKNREISMYMSSPVLVGGRVFGMTHRRRGQLFCADPATGAVDWSTTGRLAENAAIVAAGRVLLVLTTDGNLLVVAADPGKYRELAKYHVSESATWAHPVLVGSKLLVKNRDELLVFDLAG